MSALLAGKLTAPLLLPGTVTRDRLFEMLDEHPSARLCLVVAPAGWGKTTLLTEWARRAGRRAFRGLGDPGRDR